MLAPLTERSLTSGAILILSIGTVWAALSVGWETAFAIVGFGMVVILSFVSTRFLVLATIAIFTLNHANLFGSAALLQNARWLILGLCAVQAGLGIFTHKIHRRLHAFDFIAVTGLFFAFFSMTYSSDPNLTFQRSASLLLLYLAVFWLLWDIAQRKGAEEIVRLLIFSGVVIFGASILMGALPEGWQTDGRFRGIMPNPNAIGLLTAVYLPLLIWGWVRYKSLLSLLAFIAAIACTLLSGSRNGFLSMSISLVYLAIFARSSKIIVVSFLLLTVLSILLFLGVLDTWIETIPTLNRIFDNTYFDYSSGRFDTWNAVLLQIEDSWLYGYGFGIDAVGSYSLGGGRFELAGSHNTYLHNIYQLGVVGTLIFIVPLLLLSMIMFKNVLLEPKLNLSHILHAVLISGLVSAIFENWLYSPGNSYTFPFWACVMLLLLKHSRNHQSIRQHDST